MEIDVTALLARIKYDPETGIFTAITSSGRRSAGSRLGYIKADGYRLISVNKKWFYAHRLAWLLSFGALPENEIDHLNGERDDNRLSNLRLATRSENMRNTSRGRGWHKVGATGKWQAMIRVNKRRIYLGRFSSEEAARSAYTDAARHMHGGFNPRCAAPEPKAIQASMFEGDA